MDPLQRLTETLRDRYEVEREIGAGGMATVFRARDLRHDRAVALKVLKPELGAVLGVERFLAEIKVTANLQHPNILPLFDSGEADGLLYYVMPFVEGETLRARLDRERQLPVDDAIAIARAIAGALDYAHASHVIHRDLKPENILLQAGQPVLADFGIALAVANAGGARITQTGLSLGTPQYMSPEQATGDRVIDGRTDLYSLGAVLYEMLTGEPPHTGATAQAIIARVLTDKPRSARATRDTIPPHVETAVERALAKLPADRFASGREFAQALGTGYSTAPVGTVTSAPADIRVSFSVSRAKLARGAKVAGAIAVVALGVWGWLRPTPVVRAPTMRYSLEVPDSLAPSSSFAQQSLVVSPDGSELVYPSTANGTVLMRRRFDDLSVVQVAESRAIQNPRYSQDGKWLMMEAAGRVFKVPLGGGPTVRIADSAVRQSWGDDGTVVFARGRQLWRVSDAGAGESPLMTPDSAANEALYTWPFVLPGSKAVLLDVAFGGKTIDDNEIAVARMSDGRVTRLGVKGTNPRYVSTGHILFGRQDGTVSAVPFDLGSLSVTGPAVSVLDGVVIKSGGAAMFSVSDNGTLAYMEGDAEYDLLMVDRRGAERRLTTTSWRYGHPRLSPRGDQVAYHVNEESRTDIWILTLSTGQAFRLTRDGRSRTPDWTADGRSVVWTHSDTARDVIRVQASDGSGAPRQIKTAFTNIVEVTVSPHGSLAAVVGGAVGQRDISLISIEGEPSERAFLNSTFTETCPHFSPDGRWVAYETNESGATEVFIASVMNPGTRHQVTTTGGNEPAWAPDGRSLSYRTSHIVSATLAFSPRFEVLRRDTLFSAARYIRTSTVTRDYDIDRRTGEYLMRARNVGAPDRIIVVTNWLDELKARMASATRR